MATVGAVAVVYFALWRAVRPLEPEGPVAFVASGRIGSMLVLAAVVWGLAAVCSVVTISSRPEGALVAVLFGAAGASLRSGKMRSLLWLREDGLAGLFGQMIVEVLLLAVVIAGAALIVGLMRNLLWRVKPGWVWKGPMHRRGGQPAGDGRDLAAERGRATWVAGWLVPLADGYYAPAASARGVDRAGDRRAARRRAMAQAASFLLVALAVSVALLLLLMRSSDRGQVLFAMVASFALAVLVAHQFFPSALSILAWILPVLVAVLFYALAAGSAISDVPQAWMQVHNYAKALPVDWLTAGAGGAVLGYWMSERLHEVRHAERHEET